MGLGSPLRMSSIQTFGMIFGRLEHGESWTEHQRLAVLVCQVPCPHLDGRHAVFGRVIEGEEVIHALRRSPPGWAIDRSRMWCYNVWRSIASRSAREKMMSFRQHYWTLLAAAARPFWWLRSGRRAGDAVSGFRGAYRCVSG